MELNRKKNILVFIFLFLLIFTTSLLGCHKQQANKQVDGLEIQSTGEERNYTAEQVLVKFQEEASKQAISNIQGTLKLKTIRVISQPKNLYLMEILTGDSVEEVIEQLQKCPEVLQAELNYIVNINQKERRLDEQD